MFNNGRVSTVRRGSLHYLCLLFKLYMFYVDRVLRSANLQTQQYWQCLQIVQYTVTF